MRSQTFSWVFTLVDPAGLFNRVELAVGLFCVLWPKGCLGFSAESYGNRATALTGDNASVVTATREHQERERVPH